MVMAGNITLNSRPKENDFQSGDLVCASCGKECAETGIDNSFSDSFGLVTDWAVGSDCCEADCYPVHVVLNKQSYHTARKDDPRHGIKAGQRYRAVLYKAYWVDDDGQHHQIYNYEKYPVKTAK